MNNGLELYLAHLADKIRTEYNKEVDIPEYKNIKLYEGQEFPNTARSKDMIGDILLRHEKIFALAGCFCREREKDEDHSYEIQTLSVELEPDEVALAKSLSFWRA